MRTLQQVAADHGAQAPTASYHIANSFYVEDLLGGAETEEEAIQLFKDLKSLLSKGGFELKRWRSSSKLVLNSIPDELVEPMPEQDLVNRHSVSYPKALGVAWNSSLDTMATNIQLPKHFVSTKRGVISDVSRVFYILGWLAPAIVPMKVIFQQLWELNLDWDDPVPSPYKERHERWREELPLLSSVGLTRCYFSSEQVTTAELHGFSDASEVAYSAVCI